MTRGQRAISFEYGDVDLQGLVWTLKASSDCLKCGSLLSAVLGVEVVTSFEHAVILVRRTFKSTSMQSPILEEDRLTTRHSDVPNPVLIGDIKASHKATGKHRTTS